MRKNIIFIHLESISNNILWQYRTELKTIWNMMKQSYSFDNFYVSATSTRMSLLHLKNGTSTQYDCAAYFHETQIGDHPEAIRELGTAIASIFTFCGCGANGNFTHIMEGFDTKKASAYYTFAKTSTLDEMLNYSKAAMIRYKKIGKPFFFLFQPSVTHITASDRIKDSAATFSDRFRLAYLRLDQAVQQFLDILQSQNLMKNSVIVFYGDHGDELWSHGLNKGWCHVITPYASLCHTPMFIYDEERQPGFTRKLASSIDIKETAIRQVEPDFDPTKIPMSDTGNNLPPFRQTPYDGIDLATDKREYAFSQNLFALQKEYDDMAKALVKGYAVTDGAYRLTATSGGNNPKEGGLELFCDLLDPTNLRNLLDFFKLDANGDIIEFSPPASATSDGFLRIFNSEAVKHLTEKYHALKTALYEYVRGKEALAKTINTGEAYTMPENAFHHSRKRSYREN